MYICQLCTVDSSDKKEWRWFKRTFRKIKKGVGRVAKLCLRNPHLCKKAGKCFNSQQLLIHCQYSLFYRLINRSSFWFLNQFQGHFFVVIISVCFCFGNKTSFN